MTWAIGSSPRFTSSSFIASLLNASLCTSKLPVFASGTKMLTSTVMLAACKRLRVPAGAAFSVVRVMSTSVFAILHSHPALAVAAIAILKLSCTASVKPSRL